MGRLLLTQAMERHSAISFRAYDRMFPTQDAVPDPAKGLGNLIALPLQRGPRTRGNTIFLDPETLAPYEDQWAFLKTLPSLSRSSVLTLARRTGEADQALGIYLSREAQALRLPIYNMPSVICCAEQFPDHLALPRGCLPDLEKSLRRHQIVFHIDDCRTSAASTETSLANANFWFTTMWTKPFPSPNECSPAANEAIASSAIPCSLRVKISPSSLCPSLTASRDLPQRAIQIAAWGSPRAAASNTF